MIAEGVITPVPRKGRVELMVDTVGCNRRREPSLNLRHTIETRLGTSCVANTTSSPLLMKTGASLRVPSVVSRTGSAPLAVVPEKITKHGGEGAMGDTSRGLSLRTAHG